MELEKKELIFNKFHSCGNDFIITDTFSNSLRLTQKQRTSICDRRMGIGGDGLIILEKIKNYHFNLKYYNANGKIGSLCGNGAKCAIKYYLKYIDKKKTQNNSLKKINITFKAYDGVHNAEYNIKTSLIKIDLKIKIYPKKINKNVYEIDNGSPHLVVFSNKINTLDIAKEIKKWRYSKQYAEKGININFIEINKNNSIQIRTYERGVEDETLSCGTGITASAICLSHIKPEYSNQKKQRFTFLSKGGTQYVEIKKKKNIFLEIYLIGPVKFVYSGKYYY